MTSLLAVPAWTVVLAALCVAALAVTTVLLARSLRAARARADQLLGSAVTDTEALRTELEQLEEQLAGLQREAGERAGSAGVKVVDAGEYVITELAERRRSPLPAVPTVPAPVFVDIVLRESLIRTASLAAGLRRALAPEVRHRIRSEMKREVKRARKQRKTDLRKARREWEARQRAAVDAA
ncbi:MAG TPA: hypothetical protein VD859_12670 [Nocardioides sp.]|nr:hypothetical protein [Nocardioides sp.]